MKITAIRGRTGLAATAVCLLALAVVASPFATGSSGKASRGATATVKIKYRNNGFPRFFPPKTVRSGEDLRIVNKTDPHKIGPHTFALVTRKSFPRTKPERQKCFTPGHICMAVARWHGVTGPNSPVTENPAEAGAPGWSTLGSLKRKGDSWFTGNKPGTSFEQPVSIDTSSGPRRLYFMCVVHPWMHGSIKVLP